MADRTHHLTLSAQAKFSRSHDLFRDIFSHDLSHCPQHRKNFAKNTTKEIAPKVNYINNCIRSHLNTDGEMAAFQSSGACGLTFGLNVNYMPARSGSGSQPAHPHASAFSETLLPHRGNLQEGPHTAALKK
jgi:hypothetical protein